MSVKTCKAVINGTTYNLMYNSTSGKWEATITAPNKSSYPLNGHYYGVSVTAEDDAGNKTTVNEADATLGSSLQLKVKEKVAPSIAITYPAASALITNNKPVIEWNVTDADSGVNQDTIGITIDGGSKITGSDITKTGITNGYKCTYTPKTALSDGSHTIKFDVSDYDGNAATQKSVTFKIDTVPPVLNVSNPTNGLVTNNKNLTVSGTTNDATSSPVSVTVKLNGGSEQEVTVNADGSFSKGVVLSNGENTIVIKARDAAGKETSVSRTVTLDTVAPVFKSVTITPNPVDAGKTFVIAVEVTD